MTITIPGKDSLRKVTLNIEKRRQFQQRTATMSFRLEPVCAVPTKLEMTLTQECLKTRPSWIADSSESNPHCLLSDNTAQLHLKR